MSKRQTRRSISIMGKTYQRIANAIAEGKLEGSVSGYIEQLVDSDMRARDVPVPEKVQPRPIRKEPGAPVNDHPGAHFTW